MDGFYFSYSFELNPDWSRSFSPQPEILKYLMKVAEKYDILRHIECNKRVMKTIWNKNTNKWAITLSDGEVTFPTINHKDKV